MPHQPSLSELLNNPLYQPAYRSPSSLSSNPSPPAAAPARTLPAPLVMRHYHFPGGKPTLDEWRAMQADFKADPSLRIKIGTPHPSEPNRFLLSYHKDYPSGERWGTKGQLAAQRKAAIGAQKRCRQKRMLTDPNYRAARREGLRVFTKKLKDLAEFDADEAAKQKGQALSRARKSATKRRTKRQNRQIAIQKASFAAGVAEKKAGRLSAVVAAMERQED